MSSSSSATAADASSSSSSCASSLPPSMSSASSWNASADSYQAFARFTTRFASVSAKKLVEHARGLAVESHSEPKKLLYLDLASGTGASIWEFLKHWQTHSNSTPNTGGQPQVEILATDVSTNMLDILTSSIPRSLPAGISSIRTSPLNLEDEAAFQCVAAPVNLLNCCFGIFFPNNSQQVLRKVYTMLAPGGMATFVTWHYIETLQIVERMARLQKKLEKDERLPRAMHVLKWGDESMLRKYFHEAGFVDDELQFSFQSLEEKFPVKSLLTFLKTLAIFKEYMEDEAIVTEVFKEISVNGEIVMRGTAVTTICVKKAHNTH